MFVEQLEALAYRPLRPGTANASEVVFALESEGLELPEDYKEFLLNFPLTGVFDKEVVFRGNQPSPYAIDGVDTLNVLFATDRETSSDLLKVRAAFIEELPSHFLVIGEIEGGLPLCIDTERDGQGHLYLWDREAGDPSTPYLIHVCTGFTDFLNRLKCIEEPSVTQAPKLVRVVLSDELKARANALLAARKKAK